MPGELVTTTPDEHRATIAFVNARIGVSLGRRGINPEEPHAYRASLLEAKIAERQRLLATPERQDILTDVAARYQSAERYPYQDPVRVLANRLSQFEGTHVISDFDISMSYEPTNTERVYLEPNVPGSAPFEELLARRGREAFLAGFTHIVQPSLRAFPHLYRAGGHHAITLRPGVEDFFTDLKQRKIKRTILSANFQHFIEGALQKTSIGSDTGLTIQAVKHDDISSTDKATAIQLLVTEAPHLAAIYIGDGLSDMKVVEAYRKGTIGGIFALKGSPFDAQLTKEGIVHLTYLDFHDISKQLGEAETIAQQRREQAA